MRCNALSGLMTTVAAAFSPNKTCSTGFFKDIQTCMPLQKNVLLKTAFVVENIDFKEKQTYPRNAMWNLDHSNSMPGLYDKGMSLEGVFYKTRTARKTNEFSESSKNPSIKEMNMCK